MASAPAFAATPRYARGQVTAANANRDGTGTIVDIITGAASGTKIFEVVIQAQVTTTAGAIRLYIHDGTNYRLFDEIAIPANTVSASNPAVRIPRKYANLTLPSASFKLAASTEKAEAMNIHAFGGDL